MISMPSGAIRLQRHQAKHGQDVASQQQNHPMTRANTSALKVA
jgi:hypothetical protein